MFIMAARQAGGRTRKRRHIMIAKIFRAYSSILFTR